MRKIKASEIRPRMEVEWTSVGITRKCVASTVDSASPRYSVNLHTSEGGLVNIPGNAEVTVLSEPAPPQPEEPTWAGAKVLAGVHRFLRCGQGVKPWRRVLSNGAVGNLAWSWSDVCSRGPVTVVPDQGWTVPADVPEVPERIEEWPENDEHLKAYQWRDSAGAEWGWSEREHKWQRETYPDLWTYEPTPFSGPWTRVTDA